MNRERHSHSPDPSAPRLAIVGPPPDLLTPASVVIDDSCVAALDRVDTERWTDYLDHCPELAAAVVFSDDGSLEAHGIRALRDRPEFRRTRLYVVGPSLGANELLAEDLGDIDSVIDADSLREGDLEAVARRGIHAYRALGENPLQTYYFLDAKYNDVFSWFESTRWDWSEAPELDEVDAGLLSDREVAVIKQTAIAEFGTLPGAHNFLREWDTEYSFSYWALAWGAEEARHPLILCRYLHAIGLDVMAKHAVYKREPYGVGPSHASTLMMNIVSETRVSEIYASLSELLTEPKIKKIYGLLSRDEARHASAFFQYCKELCEHDEAHLTSALEQAYVWLGDRAKGFKHPTGFFYKHSPSEDGFRFVEDYILAHGRDAVADADQKVMAMIRKLTRDPDLHCARDVKKWLRGMLQ